MIINIFQHWWKQIRQWVSPLKTPYALPQSVAPYRLIQRKDHSISRKALSAATIRTLYHLHRNGYQAYLVGGSVRDLLLGQTPKDFDVVTNALPYEIKQLFKRSYLVGKRFPLAHVRHGPETIEVSTFRSAPQLTLRTEQKPLCRQHDTQYGTLEEDMVRRDFTINALYYNISDFSLVEPFDALNDLYQGIVRVIGEPHLRFQEDPVRILRALRLVARYGMRLDPQTESAARAQAHHLKQVPAARLLDELAKTLLTSFGQASFSLLLQLDLLKYLLAPLQRLLRLKSPKQSANIQRFIADALSMMQQERCNPLLHCDRFLIATLLWPVVHEEFQLHHLPHSIACTQTLQRGLAHVLAKQERVLTLPKSVKEDIVTIWTVNIWMSHQYPLHLLPRKWAHQFYPAYCLLRLRDTIQSSNRLQAAIQHYQKLLRSVSRPTPNRKSGARKPRLRPVAASRIPSPVAA